MPINCAGQGCVRLSAFSYDHGFVFDGMFHIFDRHQSSQARKIDVAAQKIEDTKNGGGPEIDKVQNYLNRSRLISCYA